MGSGIAVGVRTVSVWCSADVGKLENFPFFRLEGGFVVLCEPSSLWYCLKGDEA